MTPLIIERPELQTAVQKYGWGSLTLLFWVVYVYLWVPLLSVIAWGLGFHFFYEHMIVLEGYRGLLRVLGVYAVVIAALSVVFLGWARINYLRFRGVERRRMPALASAADLAGFFGVEAGDIPAWQQARRLTVHFDADGHIAAVEAPLPAAEAEATPLSPEAPCEPQAQCYAAAG